MLADADRFFARLRQFDLECPGCGEVFRVRSGEGSKGFDPATALFMCSACGPGTAARDPGVAAVLQRTPGHLRRPREPWTCRADSRVEWRLVLPARTSAVHL